MVTVIGAKSQSCIIPYILRPSQVAPLSPSLCHLCTSSRNRTMAVMRTTPSANGRGFSKEQVASRSNAASRSVSETGCWPGRQKDRAPFRQPGRMASVFSAVYKNQHSLNSSSSASTLLPGEKGRSLPALQPTRLSAIRIIPEHGTHSIRPSSSGQQHPRLLAAPA